MKQVCVAGTVTAMLAANGVGGDVGKSSETVSLINDTPSLTTDAP